MQIRMLHERLVYLISHHGRLAAETNQVAQRLRALLPARFSNIRREIARNSSGGHAERLALIDPRHLRHIEELVETTAAAREARIQFETHRMLYEARSSLRGFRQVTRRQNPSIRP